MVSNTQCALAPIERLTDNDKACKIAVADETFVWLGRCGYINTVTERFVVRKRRATYACGREWNWKNFIEAFCRVMNDWSEVYMEEVFYRKSWAMSGWAMEGFQDFVHSAQRSMEARRTADYGGIFWRGWDEGGWDCEKIVCGRKCSGFFAMVLRWFSDRVFRCFWWYVLHEIIVIMIGATPCEQIETCVWENKKIDFFN